MDIERNQRRQRIRLVVTEIIMVLAVVVVVGVLFAVVTGWRVNKDFSVEQYGQVDIRSYPTGASIIIDDEPQTFAFTNTSRMLTEGAHKIKLEKSGYDSWEKEVSVIPGWAIRLRYPRLFREQREPESVREVGELDFLAVAPNRDSILYAEKGSRIYKWMTINGDRPKVAEIDLNKVLDGGVMEMKWAWGSEKVLLKLDNGKWVVVNLAQPSESVNLGRYDKVAFGNGAGSKVWTLWENTLYVMGVGTNGETTKMLSEIKDFAADENEVVYLSTKGEVGMYHEGDEEGVVITEENKLGDGVEVKMMASSYAGEKFVGVATDDRFRVYRMDSYPTYGGDYELKVAVLDELGFIPEGRAEVSYNGEFFVLRRGEKMAVFDAELMKVDKYDYCGSGVWWLDDYMFSATMGGGLVVQDFDGTNVRTLVSEGVSDFPAVVSANNKWLYYVSDRKIVREQVN